MPLFPAKLLAELDRKRERFTGYSDRFGRQLDAYRIALEHLGERFADATALERALDAALALPGHHVAAGALPTGEYDAWRARGAGGLPALPFGRSFANHEEARSWAELLRGVTTLAVDGSQLMPWRDASVPVALVQAGIFENPHRPPAPYLKDVVTEVLTPEDLMGAGDDAGDDTADTRSGELLGYSERAVHLRRFQLEVETLIARMEHHAGSGADPTSIVAFYDGSLIVSFARTFRSPLRERYIELSARLLAASRRCRVPVVGYIDTSYARDLVTMLRALAAAPDAGSHDSLEPLPDTLPDPRGIHDALLFFGRLGWGDRTPTFLSARADLAPATDREPQGRDADEVAFVYFQAALDRPPARIELPRWVLEAGLLDRVMDVVRAETIVGNGYPAPIEAADAVAVISAVDRAQFYAAFQEWAEREGLPFTFSRKALSKSRRRV